MFLNIIGRLGKDAELKTSQNGNQFLTYSVAFDEYNSESKQNETVWFNVTDGTEWSKKQMKFLTKGRMINLIGDYRPTIYNSQNGPRIDHRMRALNWTFVSGGKQTEGTAETTQTTQTQQTQFQATQQVAPNMGQFGQPNPQPQVVVAQSTIDDIPF